MRAPSPDPHSDASITHSSGRTLNTLCDSLGEATPVAAAAVPAHCGELFQGIHESADGTIRRCLVTQLTSGFHCRTEVHRVDQVGLFSRPLGRTKALRSAELTLEFLGADTHPFPGLLLDFQSNIPEGLGAGSSSSDCLAASRAVQQLLGATLAPEIEYRICVSAEGSTDPIMFNRAVLAAHREGEIIADLGPAPRLAAVSFDADPLGRGVNTDNHPRARYNRDEMERLRTLLARLILAFKSGDLAAICSVSSQSARINQRHLPNPAFWYLQNAPQRLGGLGFSVAHSGTAATLLFDLDDHAVSTNIEQAVTELGRLGYTRTWTHTTVPPSTT